MGWLPRVGFATLRNATVSAVNAGRADVSIDGGTATGLPVYGGTPAPGDKVLVAVQGDSMLVLGGTPTGSCRGTLTGTVPAGAPTVVVPTVTASTPDVSVAGNLFTVHKQGFWAVTAHIRGFADTQSTPHRAFVDWDVNSVPTVRASVGAIYEGDVTSHGVIWCAPGDVLRIRAFSHLQPMTVTPNFSWFTIKYLGES